MALNKYFQRCFVGTENFCDFPTIQAAVDHCTSGTIIFIAAGIYQENLKIYTDDLALIGIGEVIIDGCLSAYQKDTAGETLGTFQTATVFLNTESIYLENLTIRNSAGAGELVGQGVALYSETENLKARNCRFLGQQDTLCLGPLPAENKDGSPLLSPWLKRPFTQQSSCFEECYIEGNIDFIFGGGHAAFSACILSVLPCANGEPGYITAAATPMGQAGFTFTACQVFGVNYYLGRPWRPHAAVTFTDCAFDVGLNQNGWCDWAQPKNRETARFREKQNHYGGICIRADWISFSE